MLPIVLLLTLGCASGIAGELIPTRSLSGQFRVEAGYRPNRFSAFSPPAANSNFVQLDPMLLPVSCERIKHLLWNQLGITAPWSAKIHLALRPAQTPDDTVGLTTVRFRDGWQYRLEFPDAVERTRYVRAVVQALLLELANRSAGVRSAEIPTWLIEGFTEQLLVSNEIEVILRPPAFNTNGPPLTPTFLTARRPMPLGPAHERLSIQPPLTFEQLSWPAPEQLSGETGRHYRSSAQLFLIELLSLPGGRAGLRAMLDRLPRFLNWQLAFLESYGGAFQQPLDVEKWWTLRVLDFTGRNLDRTWPVEETREKLLVALRSPVQVRASSNDLPRAAEATLQQIVREWDPPRQNQALEDRLVELDLLSLSAASALVPLVNEYRQLLAGYLRDLPHAGLIITRKSAQRRLALETAQKLDVLDARLAAFQPTPPPPPSLSQAALPPTGPGPTNLNRSGGN
jgi:hypothetical protein